MPRARPAREPCDCVDCAEFRPPTSAAQALVRQEPPPKSLVIYLHDGISAAESGAASSAHVRHVTALVRDGCTGLLAFAFPGTQNSNAAAALLGQDPSRPGRAQTLGERFKGLPAAALTDSPAVAELCSLAGAASVEVLSRAAGEDSQLPWPEPSYLANRMARRLGIPFLQLVGESAATAPGLAALAAPMPGDDGAAQQGSSQGGVGPEGGSEDDVDMLLVFLDAKSAAAQPGSSDGQQQAQWQGGEPGRDSVQQSSSGAGLGGDAAGASVAERGDSEALEWLDALLMNLNKVEGFRDTVLLSVVLGVCGGAAASKSAAEQLQQGRQPLLGRAAAAGAQQAGSRAPCRFQRPRQSFEFRGTEEVTINPGLLAVVVHRLPGVIRRDAVERLDVREVQQRGAGGCILAERVLAEVAYKLNRAPKYGA